MARYQNLNKIFEIFENFQFDPELSSYKKELIQSAEINKFLTFNDQFFLVFDISSFKIVYTSDSISDMMGWKPREVTLPFIYSQIVKDDRNQVIDATKFALDVCREHPEIGILETTFEVDFIMKKSDGTILKMMRKSCVFKKDKMGFPVLFLSLYTDISSFKSDDALVIATEGPDKHLFNYVNKSPLKPRNGKFTLKEIQILRKLAEGKCCKVIADEMDIKISTVRTHCKNMLGKSNFNKMNGLVAFSIKELHLI